MDKEKWVIIGLLVLIVISCIFMGSSYGDIYEGLEQNDKLETFKRNVSDKITKGVPEITSMVSTESLNKVTDISKAKAYTQLLLSKINSLKNAVNSEHSTMISK